MIPLTFIPRPLSLGKRIVFTCKQIHTMDFFGVLHFFRGLSRGWAAHTPFLSGPPGSFTTGLWEVDAGSPSLLWLLSLAPQPWKSIQNGHPGLHRPRPRQGEGSAAASPAQAQQRQQLSEQKWGPRPGLGSFSHTLSLTWPHSIRRVSLQLPISFHFHSLPE